MSLQHNFTRTLAAVAVCGLIGCAGNPYVRNAENNLVVTLGDSIFDLSTEIQRELEARAGESFRDYTLSGAKLTGGVVSAPVTTQYADAKRDGDIQTIVMNGGGNDILLPAMVFDPNRCKTSWYRPELSDRCKALVDDIYVEVVDLLNQMDTDGVRDIIYLGYYYTTGNLTNLHAAVDYGDDRLAEACSNTRANCTFLDPREVIEESDVLSDNIHPTTSGSQKLASMIWPELAPVL